MGKNLSVVDVKPRNFSVLEHSKPKILGLTKDTERYYDVTLGAGAPMGLLLTLTYSEAEAISSSKSP